jgi:hypothetical protein
MTSKRRETQLQTGDGSQCRHYWIIDSSQQIESKGRCRLCGEERVFQNKMSPSNKKPGGALEAALATSDILSPGPGDSSTPSELN